MVFVIKMGDYQFKRNADTMTHPMHSRYTPWLWLAGLWLSLCSAHAQSLAPSESVWRMGLGVQRYSESLMQLQGPEIGVHWRNHDQVQRTGVQLEADAIWGLQNYSSPVSGTLKSIPNIHTRWRLMAPVSFMSGVSYGLALHTDYNNMRGITSVGHGGYERISTQLWLPLRWTLPTARAWELDAGTLLWGQHVSRLSQATANSEDVTNTQQRGFYLQASTTLATSGGKLLPYVRWAWIDDSDIVLAKESGVMKLVKEPRNSRVQVGLQWPLR
jgi:hypothetical protein